jgi:recombination protein RecT
MTTSQAMEKAAPEKALFKQKTEAEIKALSPSEKTKYLFSRFRFMLDEAGPRLKAMMPRGVEPDRMMRVTLAEISKTPKLLDCAVESLLSSVAISCRMGLEIGGPMGQCYLVPYKDKCELIIGYKGLVALARRSGEIKSIEARAVFEGDEFHYSYGVSPTLVHTPCGETDPEKLKYAYAIANFKDGGFQMEVMGKKEIEKIRDLALVKSYGKGPWKDHPAEMWKKTPLRRLAKMLPMQAEVATRLDVEEKVERGTLEDYDPVTGEVPMLEGEIAPPQQ